MGCSRVPSKLIFPPFSRVIRGAEILNKHVIEVCKNKDSVEFVDGPRLRAS